MPTYYVYIIRCKNGKYYTGEELVYHEQYDNKMDAINCEAQLKRWSRAKKEALIKGDLNKLQELSKRQ